MSSPGGPQARRSSSNLNWRPETLSWLTGLAIDNGDDGPTPPDPLDLDQGASGLQNQPEIPNRATAVRAPGFTTPGHDTMSGTATPDS